MKGFLAWLSRHRESLISSAVFATAFLLLAFTEAAVGFVRDESVYFAASERYAQWFRLLFQVPAAALEDGTIVSAFDFNHEHPVLMKSLFGLSHLLFHDALGWFRPATAFRLPAFAVAALIPLLIYRFGSSLYGRAAGLFGAASFLLVPRQFFNAHLACFDVPIAAMWLLVVYCFWQAQTKPRYWLWTGVAYGLALATKHNALFIPFVVGPFGLYQAWTSTRDTTGRKLIALFVALFAAAAFLYLLLYVILGEADFLNRFVVLSPQVALAVGFLTGLIILMLRVRRQTPEIFRPLATLSAMAVLGPAIFYAHWPYLWHHPVDRTAWYVAFHATHTHYAWFYLGRLLREPPFPLEYVFVKTGLTVPVGLLLPMALGLLALPLRAAATRFFRPGDLRLPTVSDVLVGVNALASILIISHPSVPHFGGVKHWFPSMPFLSILAGASVDRGLQTLGGWLQGSRTLRLAGQTLLLGLIAFPAALACWRIHPYGTSYYGELAGGVPGAATLGMQRQFWSNNVTGVLPWINSNAPRYARVYLHEVNGFSFRDYQRNGMLRADLQPASGPNDATIAAYQYHQEFREHELNIWQAFGATRPVTGLYVDETPQVIVYRRP